MVSALSGQVNSAERHSAERHEVAWLRAGCQDAMPVPRPSTSCVALGVLTTDVVDSRGVVS